MVQDLSIYRLAPCTEDCSQKISKTFSHNNLESVLLFCTFEPKKCKCAFRVAVSACTLKILCCGYNMATIKKDKKIKDYDTRSCSGMVILFSVSFIIGFGFRPINCLITMVCFGSHLHFSCTTDYKWITIDKP